MSKLHTRPPPPLRATSAPTATATSTRGCTGQASSYSEACGPGPEFRLDSSLAAGHGAPPALPAPAPQGHPRVHRQGTCHISQSRSGDTAFWGDEVVSDNLSTFVLYSTRRKEETNCCLAVTRRVTLNTSRDRGQAGSLQTCREPQTSVITPQGEAHSLCRCHVNDVTCPTIELPKVRPNSAHSVHVTGNEGGNLQARPSQTSAVANESSHAWRLSGPQRFLSTDSSHLSRSGKRDQGLRCCQELGLALSRTPEVDCSSGSPRRERGSRGPAPRIPTHCGG